MAEAARTVIDPADYLTEAEILQRWPRLSRAEIRKARKANPPQIAFYSFPKASGGPCCTPAQVQEYIDRKYLTAVPGQTPCPSESPAAPSDSRSGPITSKSPIPSTAESTMPVGMTPELAQHAAEALAQQMQRPPRSRSRPLSPPHRSQPAKPARRLRLVKS